VDSFPEKTRWILGSFGKFAMCMLVLENNLQLKPEQELKFLNLLFFFIVFICKYVKFQGKKIVAGV